MQDVRETLFKKRGRASTKGCASFLPLSSYASSLQVRSQRDGLGRVDAMVVNTKDIKEMKVRLQFRPVK